MKCPRRPSPTARRTTWCQAAASYRLKQERNDRQSEFAALQWRPNDVVEVNLDFEHTERNWYENRSDLSLSNARRGITRREVDEDGIVRHLHGSTSIDSTSNRYWRGEGNTPGVA